MEAILKYGDLDLIGLRKKCDIDFAHYTYNKGMCSCCYGPKDLPKRYWKNNVVQEDTDYDYISYILFKNADNGSGCVKRDDYLAEKDTIYIEWQLSEKQLNAVIRELRKQVGSEFIVKKPKNKYVCIVLKKRQDVDIPRKIKISYKGW